MKAINPFFSEIDEVISNLIQSVYSAGVDIKVSLNENNELVFATLSTTSIGGNDGRRLHNL